MASSSLYAIAPYPYWPFNQQFGKLPERHRCFLGPLRSSGLIMEDNFLAVIYQYNTINPLPVAFTTLMVEFKPLNKYPNSSYRVDLSVSN